MGLRAGVVGAILVCGLACEKAQPPPLLPGNGGPSAHALTVAVTGGGSVTSAPAGINCGSACSASFAQGVSVTLTATPSAGAVFSSWDGACSGSGACTLAMNADAAVIARFADAPPPPGQNFTVTISTSGSGSVRSSPAGIDCGYTCSGIFPSGTKVTLVAQPDAGWQFAGFSGACSGSTCSVTMSGDQAVTATFTAVKPVDECDGLLPGALPAPVVATLPQNSCLDGTSDDGTGTFLLGYTAGSDPNYPDYLFFTIQDGKAVRIGDTVPGGTNSLTAVYSQPSGFTAVRYYGFDGASGLMNYDHLGKLQSSQGMVAGSRAHSPSSEAAIDPSGGTAALSHFYDSGAQSWTTAYRRFDKTGAPETDLVVIDHETHDAGGIGVALSGHVLIFVSQSSTTWKARWLARDGSALTDLFTLEGPTGEFPTAQFLMDGSLLVGFRPTGATWKYVVRDGQASAEALPDWIAQRSTNTISVVRGGRAYASWGSGGSCSGSLEVLATSGKSCGCLKVPYLIPRGMDGYARYSTTGRDGSLIVPRPPVNFGTCQYDLYPQLLK